MPLSIPSAPHGEDDEFLITGSDTYQTLKCYGCEAIRLRHESYCSDDEEATVHYFPPVIFRRRPDWFTGLWLKLKADDKFVEALLEEIYVALQNNLPSLATMGVRALLKKIMISRAGDHGSFAKNITEFEKLGHVSKPQRGRLEAILDAGHAAIHRAYAPKVNDVITLLDITKHIVESVFLHEAKIDELKKKIPARGKLTGGKP